MPLKGMASPPSTLYAVEKVVDGDTVKLKMGDKVETLRLIGIDTPETVDPDKPVQCYGPEASGRAKELLEGKSIGIEMDPSQGERDRYQCLLAYVIMPDGTIFNFRMIEEGFAHEYTYDKPYKYQGAFKDAEKRAKDGKKGFWSPDTCNGNTGQTSSGSSNSPTPSPTPATGSSSSPTPSPSPTTSPGGSGTEGGTPDVRIVTILADPVGTDAELEYVTIKNVGTGPADMNGWKLKDASGQTFTFPAFVLAAGAEVKVHICTGANSSTDLYWGHCSATWNNDHDTGTLLNDSGGIVSTLSY